MKTFKEIQKQRNIIDKKPLKNYQSRNLIIILRKLSNLRKRKNKQLENIEA